MSGAWTAQLVSWAGLAGAGLVALLAGALWAYGRTAAGAARRAAQDAQAFRDVLAGR